MQEVWKDIEGYEGLYQVSNLGRVKSLKGSHEKYKEKILKPRKNSNGYLRVGLCRKDFYIHRLVAQAFIPNPNNYLEVNHKDETRDNNRVDNLEWCNKTYNMNYGTIKERIGKASKGRSLGSKSARAKKVKCITTGEIFDCMTDAHKKYNIDLNCICACCKGRQKTAGKHPQTGEKLIWRYYIE